MSQRLVKLANSLQHKKFRKQHNLFVAEGEKAILDLSLHFKAHHVLCTDSWAQEHENFPNVIVSEQLLRKASSLKNPSAAVAIFEIPLIRPFHIAELPALVLDRIQDPGNLGTIVRTAAWFGIQHIICSPETVDIFNPKAVKAAMGALPMVSLHYQSLAPFLQELKEKKIPIYGTFLEGSNIYQTKLEEKSVIVIGNEGQGISDEIKYLITTSMHIPARGSLHPESLNASVSAAIVCSEMLRTIRS